MKKTVRSLLLVSAVLTSTVLLPLAQSTSPVLAASQEYAKPKVLCNGDICVPADPF